MNKHLGRKWVDLRGTKDELDIKKLLFKTLVQWCENATSYHQNEEIQKMSLAGGLLFMIWCSIVFVAIGGWAFMTITRQEKTIYHDWDDEVDEFDDAEEQGNLL